MFPQEPHSSVGDCAYNQTQTTENRSSQARVLGYYYVPSLSIEHGSLSRALPLRGQFVDTLVLQVFALITRQHVRQLMSKRNTSMPCISGRSRPTGLYRTYERYQHGYPHQALQDYSNTESGKWKPIRPCSKQATALSFQSPKGKWDFPCPLLNRHGNFL
jgi:hypothetical protein